MKIPESFQMSGLPPFILILHCLLSDVRFKPAVVISSTIPERQVLLSGRTNGHGHREQRLVFVLFVFVFQLVIRFLEQNGGFLRFLST